MSTNMMMRCIWLLLLAPAVLAGGCMSGTAESAAIARDGKVLVFKDSHGLYVVDGDRTRRLGFTLGQFYLSQDGDRLVWFSGLSERDRSMVVDYLREGRRDEVELLAIENPGYPDAVMFGPSGKVLLKMVIYQSSPQSNATEPASPPDLTVQGARELPQAKSDTRFYCWSAKSGWSRNDEPPKGFMPPVQPVSRYDFMDLAPRRADVHEIPLVEFGPDGWNARRTVWVRPDGSILEISRQNDIMGKALVNTAAFPIMFWNYFYWGEVINSPQESESALKVADNSAAQSKLGRLVGERTKGGPRQSSQPVAP